MKGNKSQQARPIKRMQQNIMHGQKRIHQHKTGDCVCVCLSQIHHREEWVSPSSSDIMAIASEARHQYVSLSLSFV